MKFDESILKYEERAVFALRQLYRSHGYSQFKMSKFEEYDLYSENKDFLVSDGVITFTDTDGKLLALKPDVTLSIIKNSAASQGLQKFYYNENVYRVSDTSHTYREIMQTGLECIGAVGQDQVLEVTELALKSLALISPAFSLHLCHVGLVDALLQDYGAEQPLQIKTALQEKNGGQLKKLLTLEQFAGLKCLVKSYAAPEEALQALELAAKGEETRQLVLELKTLYLQLADAGWKDALVIDFSIVSHNSYYSGIVFKGFVQGIASRVLSGGRYDGLLKRMGRSGSALGFAVYLDTLERMGEEPQKEDYVNIALPKGRLGEKVYDMFARAGFDCPAIKEEGRKLIFENSQKKLRFFWVKPSDVSIYVERGAADIGVAGKDILLEYAPDVYELLDLNVGKCRMAVAAKKDFTDDGTKTLRVATKFTRIAKNYYAKKCRDIDIIHLNGSIEIAPILGLSDVIVDIVETGKTLLENDLAPFETIVPISARLIANKAAYGFKQEKIERIRKELLKEVESHA